MIGGVRPDSPGPDDGGEPSDGDSTGCLSRIARTLNLPIASFFAPKPPADVRADPTLDPDDAAQVAALRRLFLLLRDREDRERCLIFVADLVARDA